MKKITLTESDLLMIVKRVLNEQYYKQFDKDEIEFLYWIFERELKPPFRKGEMDGSYQTYYNRDGELIGWLDSKKDFSIIHEPFWLEIRYKVCQAFDVYLHTCWEATQPYLESWLENHLNTELNHIYR